jgi:hypothetical protein
LSAAIKPAPRIELRDKLLWSLADLVLLLGLSRRMLERLLAAGEMPRADFVKCRRKLWTQATIFRWLEGGGSR